MDPTLAAALDGLRDIHLPAPVSFWPLAPGVWALLAAVALLAAGIAAWLRHRRLGTRRVALGELAALETRFVSEPDRAALAVALTTLLRRVALARAARDAGKDGAAGRGVAALHGEPWVAYLTEGRSRGPCSPRVARDLVHCAYAGARADGSSEPREWLAFARSFIREVA